MGIFVGMMGCIYGREDADKLPCEYQISFPRVGSRVRAALGFAVIRKIDIPLLLELSTNHSNIGGLTYMELNKKDNETDFQYHRRIVYGKLVDKTLSDYDYSELAKYAYGKEYSPDVARRMFYGSERTLELIDNEHLLQTDADTLSDIDKRMIELKKEKQKLIDQRSAFNKIVRERSREEELNEILTDSVRNGNLPRLNYEMCHIDADDNTLLVSLNDIHYGLTVNNAWTTYNPDVCMKMMCKYLDRIVSIAELHHSDKCIVYNCGDSISGNIHLTIQVSNRENVVEQVKGVSELISEFLAELSKHFNSVEYVSVAGNHSRIANKDNAPYDERLDDLIEWYLKARLSDFDNIKINTDSRVDATMFAINVYGKEYVGVHGDWDGTPTSIAALQAMLQCPIYAVLSGHKHHNMRDEVQGVKNIMAGSFVGVDDFCIQRRIYGRPEQMVMVCTSSGIVCSYDVEL